MEKEIKNGFLAQLEKPNLPSDKNLTNCVWGNTAHIYGVVSKGDVSGLRGIVSKGIVSGLSGVIGIWGDVTGIQGIAGNGTLFPEL